MTSIWTPVDELKNVGNRMLCACSHICRSAPKTIFAWSLVTLSLVGAQQAVAIPRLTVSGGMIIEEGATSAYVYEGESRDVLANDPPAGKSFNAWTISPSSAYLGDSFNALDPYTTIMMPSVSVTLTATYVTIPKITVSGGSLGCSDTAYAYMLPGETCDISADEPLAGKVFSKWTVSPTTANLGPEFSASSATTTFVMPSVSVTLTATYVAIPKATVVGGSLGCAEVNYAIMLPGESCDLLAAEPVTGKMFSKWTVNPAAVDLGPEFDATSAVTTFIMPAANVTFTATYAAIPKVTVIGGSLGCAEVNYAFMLPGESCDILAAAPATGKMFSKWVVSPTTANVGPGFSATAVDTIFVMPSVSVTFTATYIDIPKLTVTGGLVDGMTTPVYVLPSNMVTATANNVDGKSFEKWLVVPANANLGASFNPRAATTPIIMPQTSVSLTAVYVISPAVLTVTVQGFLPSAPSEPVSGEALAGLFWSIDNITWTPVNKSIEYALKATRVVVSFKSTNPRWLAPASQSVTLVATQTSTVAATATFVPVVSWRLSDDSPAASGTVVLSPANGQVLPGKSVTLTAKPATSYLFTRWEPQAGMAEGTERAASLTVAPADDTVYIACFRAQGDVDDPEIAFSSSVSCMVGVAFRAVIGINDGALPAKFSATYLPPGLKLDTTTGVISGVPTTKGTFAATIRASNSAGALTSHSCSFTVDALPQWAQGTFDGIVYLVFQNEDREFSEDSPGIATVTVSSLGKISGKFTCGPTNYTFAANSYTMSEFGLQINATATSGKVSIPLKLSVELLTPEFSDYAGEVNLGACNGESTNASQIMCLMYLRRNIWRDAGITSVATNYSGYYTVTLPGGQDDELSGNASYGSGYLTLTVDKTGGVKLVGKLADGVAVSTSGSLYVDIDPDTAQARVFAWVCASPSTYKGGYLVGQIEFMRTGNNIQLEGSYLHWYSKNPAATTRYGFGFWRDLSVSGGKYNTLINLKQYYEYGLKVGGVDLPPMNAVVRTTDWNSLRTARVTTSADARVDAVEDANINDLVLSVTPSTGTLGTGLAAPRIDTPYRYLDTGEYEYFADTTGDGVANTAGLTFTFNRTTGLFSGSFKAWYDYASLINNTTTPATTTMTHTFKTMLFEGAFTPLRASGTPEGRGFFLAVDKSAYDSGKVDGGGNPIMTPYLFNASYDFLLIEN